MQHPSPTLPTNTQTILAQRAVTPVWKMSVDGASVCPVTNNLL